MALYGISFIVDSQESFRSLEAPHDRRAIEDAGLRLRGIMRDRPGLDASARIGRGLRTDQIEWIGVWKFDGQTGAMTWMAEPTTDRVVLEALARELYEADATWNQKSFAGLPIEHWDQAEAATQARWINVARAAMAFRPRP